MGKKERDRSKPEMWNGCRIPIKLFLILGLVSYCSAWKIETVYEDESPPVQNTFFDPKFHDDKADSKAVESIGSSQIVIPSPGDISFTTVDNPQDLPSPPSLASPSIFETGTFQEFHEVMPANSADKSFKQSSITPLKEVEPIRLKSIHVPESKPILEPVDITSRLPPSSSLGLDLPTTSTLDLVEDSPPNVIYAPDGWQPNALTFPEADSTYTKPISSSPIVKWPGDDMATKDLGDIRPQMYDYVEPAISTSTEPKGHHIQHHIPQPLPTVSVSSSSVSSEVTPISHQYHYYSNPIPTPGPNKGFHFHISHSPMMNSIGNFFSSLPIFRNLPRISFSSGAGVRAHPPQSHQSSAASTVSVLPEVQHYYSETSSTTSDHSSPASSSGYGYQQQNQPSGSYSSSGSGQPQAYYGVGEDSSSFVEESDGDHDQGGFQYGAQPLGYRVNASPGYEPLPPQTYSSGGSSYGVPPPSTGYSTSTGYASAGYPSTGYTTSAGYGPTGHMPAPPSTGYQSSSAGYGTGHSQYSHEGNHPLSYAYGSPSPSPPPTYGVPTSQGSYGGSAFSGGRVPGHSFSKGSLASHYSSSGEVGDNFKNIVEDVPLTSSYGTPTKSFARGKPLTSYYTSAEEYNTILNMGPEQSSHTPASTKYRVSSSYGNVPMSPPYSGYGVPSNPPSTIRMPFGAVKSPMSVSDEFLMEGQNSYGTPKDLKRPSTLGYYRTPMGSWARIPYMKATKGYNYKYRTTHQMPIMELDPLLLDLVDDDEPIDLGFDCENKQDCGMSNEFYGISENVDITRKPKGYISNAMFVKLMKNAIKKERRRRPHRPRPHKGRRNRKSRRNRCRRKTCRKY